MGTDLAQSTFAHKHITGAIIGAAFEVYNLLGYGFLEKIYQRSLEIELIRRGYRVDSEHVLNVFYKGHLVGKYYMDLFVNDLIVVELKIAQQYNPLDEKQLLNQLKASRSTIGLLINFGRRKVEFKRFVT